jgi:Mrp family chromosome partitioning ATPase
VLIGRLALAETLIYSQQDRLTLLPISRPPANVPPLIGSVHLPVSLAQLQAEYDQVLVDAGPVLAAKATVIELVARCPEAAALVVRDCRGMVEEELSQAVESLAAAGANVLGVVENFAAPIMRKSRTEAALSAAAM